MAKLLPSVLFQVVVTILLLSHPSEQLQSSQVQTLLRVQRLLNFPDILSSWNGSTDFCNLEPNSAVTTVCYEDSITQLLIIGKKGAPMLPRNFSMESFVTTLVKLPTLKVLTLVSLGLWGPLPGKIARLSSLEILNMSSNYLYGTIPSQLSSLTSLQTLILDDNMLKDWFPDWLNHLPVLTVLSLKSNLLNGSLPNSIGDLQNLRVLALSHNHFYGELPNLGRLTNLEELELEDNAFGPQVPKLGNKLVTIVLSKNKFRSGIPAELSSFYQLQHLDISQNTFVGPFPPNLLALPSLVYLNIAKNKLTGMLFESVSCNGELQFVDLSSNLLTGSLPKCLLSDSKQTVVQYSGNCLANGNQNQHPTTFCQNEALAVGILPPSKKRKQATKAVIALGIIGGVIGGITLVGLVFLTFRRINGRRLVKKPTTKLIAENASTKYTSKLLSDARYVSQTMKLGALGLAAYRTFSLEEIEDATNNFDTSVLMSDDGSRGKMYRGQLKDGSFVAIRCVEMKRSLNSQNLARHIELISKLRHRHLVSALGHCSEYYLDDSNVGRLFFVFEYVPNGTLRSWISEGHSRRSLSWTQRISAAIGVAKGIQFLHTVSRVCSNNIKITDILLDQNLVAKISSYNIPLFSDSMGKVGYGSSSGVSNDQSDAARILHGQQADLYDFGVILLEIILGRPIKSGSEVEFLTDKLLGGIAVDSTARIIIVDPAVQQECLDQSLKTMMEVCVRCLQKEPADRPSIEDVLWNLQFAAQVQDAWRGEFQSHEGSPGSPPPPMWPTIS